MSGKDTFGGELAGRREIEIGCGRQVGRRNQKK